VVPYPTNIPHKINSAIMLLPTRPVTFCAVVIACNVSFIVCLAL
jgi:hypothetical protein